MRREFELIDETATRRLAQAVARHLAPGDAVLLDGPLGVGKTAFARYAIQAMQADGGAVEDVPSPSYTLVQVYETARGTVWHADLFRIADPGELVEIGLDEAFATAIVFVEWPDRLGGDTPRRHLRLSLAIAPDDRRLATLAAAGPGWDWLAGIRP